MPFDKSYPPCTAGSDIGVPSVLCTPDPMLSSHVFRRDFLILMGLGTSAIVAGFSKPIDVFDIHNLPQARCCCRYSNIIHFLYLLEY